MRLLLVDDDDEDMPLFVEDLEGEGHTVVHATNAADLQSAVKLAGFDGIILDLMMPAMDGIPADESESGYLGGVYLYETFIAKQWNAVPLVVLTAVDSGTSVFAAARERLSKYHGYRGWLEKPVDALEVVEKLGLGR